MNHALVEYTDTTTPPMQGLPIQERQVVQAIVVHPNKQQFLVIDKVGWSTKTYSLVTGGVEPNETVVEAATRELLEEAGYNHIKSVYEYGKAYGVTFFHELKQVNRHAIVHTVVVELASEQSKPVGTEELAVGKPVWVASDSLVEYVHGEGCKKICEQYLTNDFKQEGK